MFLKSLDIVGFKSFADKTHIEFSDGITVLVGSHGCGKSNIVEAVKWVLGERDPQSLRVKKMEDLIFCGNENKKALNFAEVAITLKNDEGFLSLAAPEVEIKRQLYRSRKSKYFINSVPVRLKDVREFFRDTRVKYSIIDQGKIVQISSFNSEKGLRFFKEATGNAGSGLEKRLAKIHKCPKQGIQS